jgi:hypothetical protein
MASRRNGRRANLNFCCEVSQERKFAGRATLVYDFAEARQAKLLETRIPGE